MEAGEIFMTTKGKKPRPGPRNIFENGQEFLTDLRRDGIVVYDTCGSLNNMNDHGRPYDNCECRHECLVES
jgi:hypothetical protein